MNLNVFGLALMGAATASAAATCPTRPRNTAGVLATEVAWVRALEKRDTSALECILDPAFSDNNWRGDQISREEVLAHIAGRPASRLHLTELNTGVEGTMALVRGLNTQIGADGKVSGSVRFTDVFLYRHNRWRAIAAQETLVPARAH